MAVRLLCHRRRGSDCERETMRGYVYMSHGEPLVNEKGEIHLAHKNECEDVSTKNGIIECSECGCTIYEHGVAAAAEDSRSARRAKRAAQDRRRGVCEDTNERFNAWICSECEATLLLMFDDYGEPTYSADGVADVPRFCPNCGRKVAER